MHNGSGWFSLDGSLQDVSEKINSYVRERWLDHTRTSHGMIHFACLLKSSASIAAKTTFVGVCRVYIVKVLLIGRCPIACREL